MRRIYSNKEWNLGAEKIKGGGNGEEEKIEENKQTKENRRKRGEERRRERKEKCPQLTTAVKQKNGYLKINTFSVVLQNLS